MHNTPAYTYNKSEGERERGVEQTKRFKRDLEKEGKSGRERLTEKERERERERERDREYGYNIYIYIEYI